MDFAKSQLEKHGWTEGSGLGREEHGMKEAIKVKLKFDQAGVGHNAADEFTNHWWAQVFNKAANSFTVDNSKDGVEMTKSETVEITNKKPMSKSMANKEMLYGRFVKSATLTNGLEEDEGKEGSDSDSSDEEGTAGKAFGALTDEELFKICGGRTAHKGARHGLKLNGKLARIEQQESAHQGSAPNSSEEESGEKKKRKKKKKDKKREKDSIENGLSQTKAESDVNENIKDSTEQNDCDNDGSDVDKPKKDKKKKKKKKHVDLEKTEEDVQNTDTTELSPESTINSVAEESIVAEEKGKKKKKKKSKKNEKDTKEESLDNCVSTDILDDIDNSKKSKKRKRKHTEEIPENNTEVKPKKKKKSKH